MTSSVYPYAHTEVRLCQVLGPKPEALLVCASGGAADGECPGHAFPGVPGDRAQVAVGSGVLAVKASVPACMPRRWGWTGTTAPGRGTAAPPAFSGSTA